MDPHACASVASDTSTIAAAESDPNIPMASFSMPMPFPGTPSAPSFDGADITDFLELYDDMCDDYRVNATERLRRLPRYCETIATRQHIKDLIEFSNDEDREALSYEALKKVLKEDFKAMDTTQLMESRSFLCAFKDRASLSTDVDVVSFCRRYSAISSKLVREGKLDQYTQVSWFLQGLPKILQTELFYRYDLDLTGDVKPKFSELVQKALDLEDSRKLMLDMIKPERNSKKMKALVEKTLPRTRSADDVVSDQNRTPKVSLAAKEMLINSVEKRIDDLSNLMQEMFLNWAALQQDHEKLLAHSALHPSL